MPTDNVLLQQVVRDQAEYGRASRNAGGEEAGLISSLIETCKLNSLDPYIYLRDALPRTADHPIKRVDGLLPLNRAAE